jgi:N-glycosidase YbiA
MGMVIKFYSTDEDYGNFSNFSRHPITLDDRVWPTSEHYFQAQKFIDSPGYQEQIITAETPQEAAQLGRDKTYSIRKDWDSIRNDVMRLAVLQKFSEHQILRDELLSTEEEKIVEVTTDDYHWGEGSEGTGTNMLGIILMEVRYALREEEKYLKDNRDLDVPIHEDNPAYQYQRKVLNRLGL